MESGNFVTDTNKAPLVQTLTLFFLSSAIICTLCRIYTKWVVVPVVAMDDYLVPVSTLFLTGQSIAVTVMAANGYGKPSAELNSAQMTTILKAQYAAMLLYIPSLFFSKLPTLAILNLISPIKRFKRLLMVTAVAMLAWAGTSEIVSAFQCRPLRTWDYVDGHCMNRLAFYTYFEAMNGFTDLLLVLLPFAMVVNIKTSLRRRIDVLAVFCMRLTSVAAIITKIAFLWSERTEDPFFGTWPVTICTQLIQFLSLMSACILYLRPFLESLTSGFVHGDDLRRRGQIKPYIMESEGFSHELTSHMGKSNGHAESNGRRPHGDYESGW